jgi:5-formyltetrahydrofolate cyclo-ligase
VPRRHDHDAAGDPEVLAAKAALREEAWAAIRTAGATRFPGPEHRIPNFVGAEAAADRLRATDRWMQARAVKANPDSPQLPVRQRALEDGKTLFMAVPRLASEQPFIRLDPEHLTVKPRAAASIKGSSEHGQPVAVEDLDPVDVVVSGCVAVDPSGGRLGKGGGFSDLEFAVAAEAGLVDASTVVVTTVHERQVLAAGTVPTTSHDLHVDVIVTADQVVRCARPRSWRLPQLHWNELTDDKIAAIPLLGRMRP